MESKPVEKKVARYDKLQAQIDELKKLIEEQPKTDELEKNITSLKEVFGEMFEDINVLKAKVGSVGEKVETIRSDGTEVNDFFGQQEGYHNTIFDHQGEPPVDEKGDPLPMPPPVKEADNTVFHVP